LFTSVDVIPGQIRFGVDAPGQLDRCGGSVRCRDADCFQILRSCWRKNVLGRKYGGRGIGRFHSCGTQLQNLTNAIKISMAKLEGRIAIKHKRSLLEQFRRDDQSLLRRSYYLWL